MGMLAGIVPSHLLTMYKQDNQCKDMKNKPHIYRLNYLQFEMGEIKSGQVVTFDKHIYLINFFRKDL